MEASVDLNLTGNPLREEVIKTGVKEVEVTVRFDDGTTATEWFRPGPTKERIRISRQTTRTGKAYYIQYYGESEGKVAGA